MAERLNTFDDKSTRLIAEMVRREMRRVLGNQWRELIDRLGRPTSYKYTRLFELDEELSAGGTANAKLVRWDEDTEDWVASDEAADEFEVVDFIGSMSGPAGTRGIAQNMFGKWVIIQLACE